MKAWHRRCDVGYRSARDRNSIAGCLAAALLFGSACTVEIPEDKLACSSDANCPRGWHCVTNDGRSRCFIHSVPAQSLDASSTTSAVDASIVDGSNEPPLLDATASPPRDANTETPTAASSLPEASTPRDAAAIVDAATTDAGQPPPTPSDPCQLDAADETQEIFVSSQRGAPDNCGSTQQPCSTIASGITQAALQNKRCVVIDTGMYTENTLQLAAGISLIGGWNDADGHWTRQTKDGGEQSAVIASSSHVAVVAEFEGTARLDTLTVRTRDTDIAAGESMYGILVRGPKTRLTLSHVDVVAARGGDGSPGADGVSPAAASGTCSSASGATGASSTVVGSNATAPTLAASGYVVNEALAGNDGQRGANGTAGGAIECVDCATKLKAVAPQLVTCGPNSACFSSFSPTTSCASQAGESGCGGEPGGAGTPGGSGGSSVALFVFGGEVTLESARLEAGRGGTGGRGGLGGKGASGSAGVAHTGPVCTSRLSIATTGAGASGPSAPGGSATAGGNGGSGGDGSAAGAGAGGNSFAIVRGDSAIVTGIDSSTLIHGEAGKPGSDSGGIGGQAGDAWPM